MQTNGTLSIIPIQKDPDIDSIYEKKRGYQTPPP
jgi:hypothetical protein